MSKLTRTAGLLFLAASSVYISQAALGESRSEVIPDQPAGAVKGVTVLEDVTAASDAAALAAPDAAALAAAPQEAIDSAAEPTPIAAAGGNSVTETDVTISDAGTVEIHVNEANLVEVLRMLSLQSQRNIVASKSVRGTVTANLYDVTVREALDAILHANGYAYREKGNFIYVYTVQELEEIEQAERKRETRVFRLHYTPAANAVNMIKPVLSAGAQVAVTTPATAGIKDGDGGGNSHSIEDIIVVTDYPEQLDRIAEVLKSIDERPQQVLVEATILQARLNDENALGVDFTILGGVDFSTLTSNNGLISGANIGSDASPSASSGGTGNNFTQGINGGARVGIVTSDIAVFVSALETITDTTVLANPKVLALNKQVGRVLVGREQGYRGGRETTDTSTTETVEMLESGTKLLFRPYIGSDGYIRMEIHPEDSIGEVVDGLPRKDTTEVTTNVLVKDGHTIVIGGLFRESSISARRQIPLLGNLPLAGPLFRRQADSTTRDEIIILITPHIVKNDSAYAASSEELLQDAELLRVGVRKGMMPWGRERLAEGSYEIALRELAKDNPDHRKALWHLNAATNLNPKFIEAVKLKQTLTGREITSADNSTVRSFVTRQILAEQATPAPIDGPVNVDPAALPEPEAALEPEAMTEVPTTQPVAEATGIEAVSESPTTQPTNPVAEVAQDEQSDVVVVMEMVEEEPQTDEMELPFTVTELPTDEIGVGMDSK